MPTDYIMRMVEEFARVLARVIFFKEIKQYVNAVDELDNLEKMLTGLTLDQIKELGLEGVKNFFDLNNTSNIERVFYSAKTLKEKAMIDFEQGKVDEGMADIAFALGMFELIQAKGIKDYPGLEQEISFIKRNLN